MNELIEVTLNDNHEPVISGRQLHEALGVKTEYRKWFGRMSEYGFEENQDFARVTQKCPTLGGLQDMTDHITVSKTPLVTGKGQQYFINKFLNQERLTS